MAGEGHVALGRLDRGLERAYARLGWRLPLLHWAVATGLAGAMALLIVFTGARHDELSTSETIRVMGLAALCVAGQLVMGYVIVRLLLRPLRGWLEGGRDPRDASAVWLMVLRLPADITRRTSVPALFVTCPALVLSMNTEMELDASAIAVAALVGGSAIGVLIGIGAFGLELFMRPLMRDIQTALHPRPPTGGGIPVRRKLVVTVPLIAVFSSCFAVLLSAEPGSPWSDVLADQLVVTGLGLVLLVPAAFLLARSMMQPLDDLLGATERLKAGDLQSRVTELSGAEYGVLARSFNEAIEGLEERQRLALANAELLEEVQASRARIVAASDAERRRVERNIHDGAQQRLILLALQLRQLRKQAEASGVGEVEAAAEEARVTLDAAITELRELARGLHPTVLATEGLLPALEDLATRATVPVSISAPAERFGEAVESTAYFVISEALANVGKYAEATAARVAIARNGDSLMVEVADDGIGGAAVGEGSGLTGLADRVAALNGSLSVTSPPGQGTTIMARLPLA